MNCKQITKGLTKNIAEFVRDKKVIIGISGGIDSALTYKLLALAVGKENILPITMPSVLLGNQCVTSARLLAKSLGFDLIVTDISGIVAQVDKLLISQQISKQTLGNIKSRARMIVLYSYANDRNGLVAGTSNKTEIALGYYTKYGDGGVDFEVIGDLYKTEVWELSKYLDLPREIIEAEPSAELWLGQTDEKELGLSYQEIDKYLRSCENNESFFSLAVRNKVEKFIDNSEHKRKMPPIVGRGE